MITSNEDREHVDAAALAGTALAGVLAVMIPEGPFDWTSVTVGGTLIILLMAYLWNRPRTIGKSMAFSAVLALCSSLIVGFIFENFAPSVDVVEEGKRLSRVHTGTLAIAWLVVGLLILVTDRVRNRRG